MNGKIGLFGGTFDPIHNGHIQICKSFLKSGLIDEIWIIPASIPPQKEDTVIATFAQRFDMLTLAFQSNKQVKILDIEDSLPKPNYTIQTVRHLKKIHRNIEFKLCIGSDSLKFINTWYKYQELLQEIDLLVVNRPGISIEIENFDPSKIQFINHTEINLSSSEIRATIRINKSSTDIPKAVMDYILRNKLYL